MSAIYIAGRCSVPSCEAGPPKEQNPFCQTHWSRLPGRIRRQLTKTWKSRTKGHHGKVVKGHDWTKAIASGVRFFGAVPRDELPRADKRDDALSYLGIAPVTRAVLEAGGGIAVGEIDPTAAIAIREINEKRKEEMSVQTTTHPPVDADGMIHVGNKRYSIEGYAKWRAGLRKATATRTANRMAEAKARQNGHQAPEADDAPVRRYTRRAGRTMRLIHNGRPNEMVVGLFREWLLDRYMRELPKPSPEEIFAAGMLYGASREREGR